MKITIHAKSSSGGFYPVDFSDESGALRVFCHCPAGALQQLCKHKLALLKGEKKLLHDPTEEGLLLTILTSEAYAALRLRLINFEQAMNAVDRELIELKSRERQLKREIAYELTFGRSER